jgi:hypothetical protein
VTKGTRTEVNRLFDEFVPAAMERRDPRLAYGLVTPSFRAGVTRSAWLHGQLPVYPYEARGATFHGWTVDTSYPKALSVELFLQPRDPKGQPVSVNVDLARLRGRWLIDSFYPRTSYASTASASSAPSSNGGSSGKRSASPAEPSATANPHANLIWVVLGGFLALVVVTPVAIVGGGALRGRMRRRRLDL